MLYKHILFLFFLVIIPKAKAATIAHGVSNQIVTIAEETVTARDRPHCCAQCGNTTASCCQALAETTARFCMLYHGLPVLYNCCSTMCPPFLRVTECICVSCYIGCTICFDCTTGEQREKLARQIHTALVPAQEHLE